MAYFIEAGSERGKVATKYGSDFIHITIQYDRQNVGELHIDAEGVSYCAEGGTAELIDPRKDWGIKEKRTGTEAGR